LPADLPPAPMPPIYGEAPLPPQDVFEGWYLGGTIGGATVTFDAAPGGTTDTDGILGGAIGGYSWQSGPFVLGVEGDIMAADISGSSNFNGGLNTISPGIDAMTDLRLRAGVTVTPQVLLFATAGGAWANADLPVTGPGGASRSADLFGWSVGGGAEVALNPNWSARFDYQFTDFDSETVNYPGRKIDFDPDANTYRGSLIYRF
jgi:outer membrane immunogenic protein